MSTFAAAVQRIGDDSDYRRDTSDRERWTIRRRFLALCDVDAEYELVNCHCPVAIAVAPTSDHRIMQAGKRERSARPAISWRGVVTADQRGIGGAEGAVRNENKLRVCRRDAEPDRRTQRDYDDQTSQHDQPPEV